MTCDLLVARSRFELLISALRGRRPGRQTNGPYSVVGDSEEGWKNRTPLWNQNPLSYRQTTSQLISVLSQREKILYGIPNGFASTQFDLFSRLARLMRTQALTCMEMTALALLAQPGEKGISAVLDTSVGHRQEAPRGSCPPRPWGNAQRVHHVPANRQVAHTKRRPARKLRREPARTHQAPPRAARRAERCDGIGPLEVE